MQTPVQSQQAPIVLQSSSLRPAVSAEHAAAVSSQPVKRYNDTVWMYTTLGSLVAIPFISYFYYQHRKEHMDSKRHQMLQQAQARYKAANSG